MRPRYRNRGTGLHRYWYMRLIILLLTVVLPMLAITYIGKYYPDLLPTDEMSVMWVVIGWLFYVFVVVAICLKIEDILEKKRKSRNPQPRTEIHINGMQSLSDEEKRAVSTAFGQMNIVFSNADDDDDDDDDDDEAAGAVCPKCHSHRVVKTDSGLCVCMKCAHRFDP